MMKLQFALPVPLNQGCKVTVQLPPQYNISTITLVGALQVFGNLQQFTALNKNFSENSFTIFPCRNYIDNNNLAVLYISNLTQPPYEKATDSVKIQIKSSADFKVAQVQSGITFTPYRGTAAVEGSANVKTVQTPTAITFKIWPSHTLYQKDQPKVIISFPLNVLSPCSTSVGSCLIRNQSIVISDWLTKDYIPSTNPINITVGTVVNPLSINPIAGFDLLIAAFGLYAIDEYEGKIPWSLAPGPMSKVEIIP
jgi:hypothetical protein